MKMARLITIVLLGLIPCLAHARSFRLWTPDDLLPVSQLICTGVVTKLEKVAEERATSNFDPSLQKWKAHIKVLSIFKGSAAGELDLLYTLQFYPLDGPIIFTLKEGQRYRFFLNPAAKKGDYSVALENNIDNFWSVENLGPSESNDSPPLLKDEATRLALSFYFKAATTPNAPEVQAYRYGSFVGNGADPNVWTVQFWFHKGNVQSVDPDAEINVLGDRSIGPDSWVASGPANLPREITAKNVGDQCWIRILSQEGNDLRGTIQRVSANEILLTNVHARFQDKVSASAAVPISKVRDVQLLRPIKAFGRPSREGLGSHTLPSTF